MARDHHPATTASSASSSSSSTAISKVDQSPTSLLLEIARGLRKIAEVKKNPFGHQGIDATQWTELADNLDLYLAVIDAEHSPSEKE